MASDVRVVEDGLDRGPPQPRVTSSWVWLVTGIAIGLGFGVVLVTPSSPDAQPQPPVATAPPIAPVENVEDPQGIADVIPGFSDALVVVTEEESQSLSHLLWPVAQPQVTRSLPGGGPGLVSFDVSGVWLASAVRVPDADGMVLSMGRPSGMMALVSNVTSFSWHDEEPGRLSYTQIVDGQWLLWVVGQDRSPDLIARGLDDRGEVVAWGDWGWALQTQSGEVTLLTSDGELNGTHQWVVLDSKSYGLIVHDNESLKLVAHNGEETILATSVESIGGASTAELSPDNTKLAVGGGNVLTVLPVDGDGEIINVPIVRGPSHLTWSSDSRFVVFPSIRGIIIIDTIDAGHPYEELTSRQIRAVGVIPLSGS